MNYILEICYYLLLDINLFVINFSGIIKYIIWIL